MVQVADYWPKTEMYSSIVSPLSVEHQEEQADAFWLQGAAGYPGIGSAQGRWDHRYQTHRDLRYQQAAPMQVLQAAGTLERRSGVFFKLHRTPQATLEGNRSFELTLEVPAGWQADLLEVQVFGYGRPQHQDRPQLLGQSRFWLAVYLAEDVQAAQAALGFLQQQARLREVSDRYRAKVEKSAYPTPVHRWGEVLDIYQPEVARNYLQQWMFGATSDQPNSRLPVELRVAMLDFIDSRRELEQLSGAQAVPQPARMAAAVTRGSSQVQ
jgi:hypothetical protein